MRRYIVGVMGPGDKADEAALTNARTLGKLIAEEHWVVLSGGRDAGVMKAVNEGAKLVLGSLTVGILPTASCKPSPNVDIVIVTEMHNARNNINVLSSDVVVACGRGGSGTVSEIALALKAGKTVVLMGADLATNTFFQDLGKNKVITVETPSEAIEEIKQLCANL
jgi:uncharacterized protein (TIGR00725 family)